MYLKMLFSKWAQVAGLLLIGGALAWAMKLCVIISTNGRIIETGAAALLMQIGLLMLFVGSTGIGYYFSHSRSLLLRIMAIILSPAIVVGSFMVFPIITTPLFQNSSVWYAQQEAPIGLAVLFYLTIGCLLYRGYRAAAS